MPVLGRRGICRPGKLLHFKWSGVILSMEDGGFILSPSRRCAMPDELSGPPAVVSTDTVFSVAVEDTRDAPAGSGHSAETPLPQLDRSDALFAPDDTRYRRPLVVRGLRSLGRWCWIILAAYPLTGIYNFIGDINAGQPFAFHTAGQAFYLDRIVPAVFVVPPIVAVALLALIARICFLDQQRECAEMERRAKRDQRIIEYGALAQHAAQAAAGAAIATAGAIGGAAVLPVIERAGEVGQEVGVRAVQPLIESATPIARAVGEAAVAPLLEAVVALKSGESESQAPQGPPFDEALLPAPEHFIGRVDDRPWLVERLKAGGTTSITALGGIGGIGKTALAAVAIREARDAGHFRDGIGVILCQDKTDPSQDKTDPSQDRTDPIVVLRLALTRFDPYRRKPEATDA